MDVLTATPDKENDDLWSEFEDLKRSFEEEAVATKATFQPPIDFTSQENRFLCSFAGCSGGETILEDGNYVCCVCGTIQERMIDYKAEWRYYGAEDSKGADPTRCGLPSSDTMPESLGSVIVPNGRTKLSKEMYKISKYQKWNSMTYRERNMYSIIDAMTIKAVNGGIPQTIIEDAKILYKKMSEIKISRGENREGLIASSIYMSCKKNMVPRSAKEIAKIFNLNITVMTKGCKKFHDIFSIYSKNEMTTTTSMDFVMRFCSKLDFPADINEICKAVILKEKELAIISENAPPSIAAGCIYLVNVCCKMGKTKKEISAACDISEITINKCYKKLQTCKMYLFSEEVIRRYGITE